MNYLDIPFRVTIDTPAPYQCDEYLNRLGTTMHWHDFCEIEFFTEGGCKHILNTHRQDVGRGVLVIVSNTDLHGYRVLPPYEYYRAYSAHFSENLLSSSVMHQFLSLSGQQYVCRNEEQFELLRHEFALLHAVVHEDLAVNDAKRMATNVLSRIILLASSFFSSAEPSEVLPPEIDYINRYFRHPITLEEVANVVGLSSYYFSRKFHHDHGITFQEYLIKKRLAWAHDLILNSPQSVSRISEESGFHSRNHFIKKFKQYYGCSPSDLRNKKEPNS